MSENCFGLSCFCGSRARSFGLSGRSLLFASVGRCAAVAKNRFNQLPSGVVRLSVSVSRRLSTAGGFHRADGGVCQAIRTILDQVQDDIAIIS